MDNFDRTGLASPGRRLQLGRLMEKFGPLPDQTSLLSPQVTGSRYFFLHLAPPRSRRCIVALGGREHCNPDYFVDRQSFMYYVLEYVAEGAGSVEIEGRRHELRPGSLFCYRPTTHCVMRSERENPMVKYFLCIAGGQAAARLTRAGLAPDRARTLAAHSEIRSVFEEIIREGRHSSPRTAEICALLFEWLLLKISDAVTHSAQPSELGRENFLRCKALIDAQVERLGSLQDIATAVGLDSSSVCRLFRRYQGISPYQYLLRRKMNLAAEFLVETGGLVKEAALRVGFADPYHFSRCFKSTHGVSPRNLRRR